MISPMAIQESDDGGGIIILNPSNNEQKDILREYYIDSPAFNQDSTKILAVTNKHTQIIEYDIDSKSIKDIYNDPNAIISEVEYIPNQRAISFIKNLKLYYFDLETKSEKFITDIAEGYSWSTSKNCVIFTCMEKDGLMVYKYNLENGKSERLFNGKDPVYSNDDKYIAYLKPGGRENLVVRELSSGIEWEYKKGGIYFYKFSPDGNYIAIQQERKNAIKEQEMVVWDFKNNNLGTLIEKIRNGRTGSFDWK